MVREKLLKLREGANLTQEIIAKELEISRSFYGHIETGERNPTYGLALRIADFFNVPVEEIFSDLECFRLKRRGSKAS